MQAAGHSRAYRPDIDTLRAVAVSSVLLFHANIPGFGGGFIGVDVFFVISGFLITGILRQDPSITRFYIRRAARILPALFAMLLASWVVGYLLLLPTDFKDFATSVLTTLGFSSNILFWQQSGYFDTSSDLKPLLHTWSLAVEEQFYILFPLLMIVARRWKDRTVAILLAVAAIATFLASVYLVHAGRGVMAFFFSPARAWELLAGSLLALGAIPPMPMRWLRTLVAVAGLAMIVGATALITEATPFPGLAALPPVLGTVLVIAAGSRGDHGLSRLLALKPVLFIGLISYSLYLWHWPILAYLRYYRIEDISITEGVLALIVSVILATLSWRYVERPFRGRNPGKLQWLYFVGAIVFVAMSAAVLLSGGLENRFSPRVASISRAVGDTTRCALLTARPFGGSRACAVGNGNADPSDADIILWGDSHAEMYRDPVGTATGTTKTVLILARSCAPVASFNSSRICAQSQGANLEQIAQLKARTIILALNWPQYGFLPLTDAAGQSRPSNNYATVLGSLEQSVDRLTKAGKRVVIVGPIAAPGFLVPSIVGRELAFRGKATHPLGLPTAQFERDFGSVLVGLARLDAKPGVDVIYAHRWICKGGNCPFVSADNQTLYADYGHLSKAYARSLAPMFRSALGQ